MNQIWMFYPENDVALAANCERFTPPKHALELRRFGGFIVNWMASEGDFTIYEPIDPDYENWLQSAFNLPARRFDPALMSVDKAALTQKTVLMPWGWSSAAVQTMLCWGVEPRLMPSKERLMRLRDLSNRRSAMLINSQLAGMGIHAITDVQRLTSEADIIANLAKGGRRIFKAPWSSSGRGIIDSSTLPHNELTRRLLGIIKRQGCVFSEPFLDKVLDFAMLFSVSHSTCRFIGLSVFENTRSSAYQGNIVAPQSYLTDLLTQYASTLEINNLADALQQTLTHLLGADYEGYCGVDMMIYRNQSGDYAIAPCIELNLRMTMGILALHLAEKHLADGSIGRMHIARGNSPADSRSAQIVDHKLVDGSINLNAPNQHFNFIFSASTPR